MPQIYQEREMASRQDRKRKKEERRNKQRTVQHVANLTNLHAERDLQMAVAEVRIEEFKMPISEQFVAYMNVIVTEMTDEGTRMGDFLCQAFANILEQVHTFSGKFEEFWREFEPVVGNMFTDAPVDKIRDVFRNGLKLTQEHFLDNEWYGVDGEAECFISGYKTPSTLVLKFYKGKEKHLT